MRFDELMRRWHNWSAKHEEWGTWIGIGYFAFLVMWFIWYLTGA